MQSNVTAMETARSNIEYETTKRNDYKEADKYQSNVLTTTELQRKKIKKI